MVQRVNVRDGHGESGTVYRVSALTNRAIQQLDNRAQKQGITGHKNRAQLPDNPHVVSSSINTTTTTDGDEDDADMEALKGLVHRFNLDEDFRLGVSDLAGALRFSQSSMARFALAVEHIAFYLRSPDAKGIAHPKAWAIRHLRQGFYGEPAGFVSWEEQQLAAEVAAANAKVERLKKLQTERFNANFEAWFLDLDPARKSELLRKTNCPSPNGPAAKHFLRTCLRRRQG